MRSLVLLTASAALMVFGVISLSGGRPASGAGSLPTYPGPDPWWSFPVDFNIPPGGDPSNHQEVLQIPTNMKLFVQQAPPGQRILVRPAEPLSNIGGPIVKEADGRWAFNLSVTTSILRFSGVEMTFTGHISADFTSIFGSYTLGANHVFPGGNAITFEVKMKRDATATVAPAATSTATQPAPQPTATATATPPPQATPTVPAQPTATVPPRTATRPPAATPTSLPRGSGDANKNGYVDSTDALLVLQHAAGLFDLGARAANADVDRDGYVTSRDAQLIEQYDAGLIHQLPVPPR